MVKGQKKVTGWVNEGEEGEIWKALIKVDRWC
jgi:hypothetical protein